MATYLRVVRQQRWLVYPDLSWLPPGELQADALLDLQTSENALSVYIVGSEGDEISVAVAIAATRHNLSNVDYRVFDDRSLVGNGIALVASPGATPDASVNTLHYHIPELSVSKVNLLIQAIAAGRRRRVSRKHIKVLLAERVAQGKISKATLEDTLARDISQDY